MTDLTGPSQEIVRERTPNEKAAYLAGMNAGAKMAFALMRANGGVIELAESGWDDVLTTIEATV